MRATILVCTCLIALSVSAFGQSQKQIADEVIAMTKAQWAAEMQHNATESMKNVAEEYTEFIGDYATRLDGKTINTHLEAANMTDPGVVVAAEMANEKVQVYGDVAILTYNYVGISKDKDGIFQPSRAKSTRVFAKLSGKWMLVHGNFGADPLPK
jgi:ketosteroid isomerase-like protein